MPISLSAKKSLRKTLKNHKANVLIKNKLKTLTKEYLAKPTQATLDKVYSLLDKATKNHIFHFNKVSRLKAKYAKVLVGKNEKQVTVKAKKPAAKKAPSKKTASKKTTKKMS